MKKIILSAIVFFGITGIAEAHEAYVLDKAYFWQQIRMPFSTHALDALKDSHNLQLALIITGSILFFLTINFLFRETALGSRMHRSIEKLAPFGPLFVRIAIATAFFFSASSWSFLGPELSIHAMPFAQVIRILLFAVSFLIAIGLFTEIAALVALVIFTVGFFVFGSYLITYLNYLGEIIVLLLFGMRMWSLDRFFFGPLRRFSKWKKYETVIVRIFYGVALAYAAITVKFLHPDMTIKVVTDWNLTQFHWLFPSDPLLVVLGAGLSEFAIGLFIVLGFEMRLTVLVSLFYITLSLLYFRELVWPHLMLYGISLNLLVQPEVFTVDHLLFEEKRRHWWKRPFRPHR